MESTRGVDPIGDGDGDGDGVDGALFKAGLWGPLEGSANVETVSGI